jgi:hypothetical protein
MGGGDFHDDLEFVVERTGHSRFRVLTDPADPAYQEGYIGIVRGLAAGFRGEPPPPPRRRFTAAQVRRAQEDARIAAKVKKCPDREPVPGCGCSGEARCRRDGAVKQRLECYACVEAAGLVQIG